MHGVPQITPASAVGELLVGFGIGLGAALLVGAAESAGDLIAIQIGLSGAALLDPLTKQQSPVLSNFLSLFAITILLALNVHLGMIEALAASLRAVPVGSAMNLHAGLASLLSLAGTLFLVGLRFAAPVIGTVMVGNAALAVLSRATPQLNILSVAFPLQIGLGLFALGVALPFIASTLGNWPGQYDQQLTSFFTAVAPAGMH
jgi:flagellar biosynthetic protein FliR